MHRRLGLAVATVCERHPEKVRLPVLRVAAATALGDADETKRFGFPDCRRHGIVVHAKSDEGLFRNWQPAIVMTAVPSQLDLDPGDNAMCGKAQRSICRAFQHFDGARRPLAADAVLARRLHATFLDFA
jgi:hypothetical protein